LRSSISTMDSSDAVRALRRNSSNNTFIKSLLSDQSSAGRAAATFEFALQKNLAPPHKQTSLLTKQEEGIVLTKPFQVQCQG
jgi:hypothetical protein